MTDIAEHRGVSREGRSRRISRRGRTRHSAECMTSPEARKDQAKRGSAERGDVVVLHRFGLPGFQHVAAMEARVQSLLQIVQLIFRHPTGKHGKLTFTAYAIERRFRQGTRQGHG